MISINDSEIIDTKDFSGGEIKCAEMIRCKNKYLFICYHCGETFNLAIDIMNHVDIHLGINLINDDFCDNINAVSDQEYTFSTKDESEMISLNNFRNNLSALSSDDHEYSTIIKKEKDEDGKSDKINNDNQLSQIKNDDDSVKHYSCLHCKKNYRNKSSLNRHYRKKHPDDYKSNIDDKADLLEYKCEFCHKIYHRKYKLQQHMKQHMIAIPEDRPFKCNICIDIFDSYDKLKTHLAEIHGKFNRNATKLLEMKRKYKCYLCPNKYGQMFLLEKHLETHSEKFECDICSTIVLSRHKLIKHMSMHNERNLKCPHCDFMAKTNNTLGKHIQHVHDKSKIYSCEICKKVFHYKQSYIYHIRSHTGERPYQCSKCGMSFSVSSQMTVHTNKHHSTETFQCDLCTKLFRTLTALKRHLKTHTDERLFSCEICSNQFKSRTTLRQHKSLHDTIKRYKCNFCDMRFAQSAGRRGHERLQHLKI